ncbi:hypothetical protein T08_15808 [Trichinella sp. T8]|nr:hypothetical protein T08_15808 [Trichinella sp. T8]
MHFWTNTLATVPASMLVRRNAAVHLGSQDVHADSLQGVFSGHDLHWRTVVLRQAFPPHTLHACAAPCLHVASHSGLVESASHSCQCPTLTYVTCVPTIVHGLHDFISERSRHQHLLSPFLSHESAAISPDEAILLQPIAPLLPQHVHVAATYRGAFHRPARATQDCRSSQISRSACWAANNCSLKPWVASSARSLAAWTAHAMPSTGAR